MHQVIGITGVAQCGKDTAADFIMSCLPQYEKRSFADPMKLMLSEGLGLTEDQLYGGAKERQDTRYSCSPRHMMQTLGTEWGRKYIHPDIWVKAMDGHLADFTIIPDVRFENEAAFVRERGILMHVAGRNQQIGAGHESEFGVEFKDGDIEVVNKGSLEEYEDLLTFMIRRHLR